MKELIQQDCTSLKIAEELENILHDHLYRTRMLINYDELAEQIGSPGASVRAAQRMVRYLKEES